MGHQQLGPKRQDELAHRSHRRAARAWDDGFFDDHVMAVHVPPAYERTVTRDGLVRPDSKLEDYAELPPVFDRDHGTVTAGSSSPLTDGASALALMSAAAARREGLEPLAFIRSAAFSALDPSDQLLLGPAHAAHAALEAAGVTLEAMDLVDIHEAFAATVLSVLDALASEEFCRRQLGRDRAVGRVDDDKLNVNGGSIALGHPFAATGARQIAQTALELERRSGDRALVTACAAGGMAAALVLEAC